MPPCGRSALMTTVTSASAMLLNAPLLSKSADLSPGAPFRAATVFPLPSKPTARCGWGATSGDGRLGLGDAVNRSSPVQVGTLGTWSAVSAGSSFSLALKTDGTLWSWGGNNDGRLGFGDAVYRSSPVQVGTLGTWSAVSAVYFSTALKTDGTLWAWGIGTNGQLGQADIINR